MITVGIKYEGVLVLITLINIFCVVCRREWHNAQPAAVWFPALHLKASLERAARRSGGS